MIDLVQEFSKNVSKLPNTATRDRREFYASEALAPRRDIYWKFKGEPETNPTDFIGSLRMLCGEAIERAVRDSWLSKMHLFGLHLVDSQVKVGGSNPDWNGFVDFYIAQKKGSETDKALVEFKTKWGFGADLLYEKPEPSKEYLAQLGLYLEDYYNKGKKVEGILFYILLSDNNFGSVLQFNCRYDPETTSIVAYRFSTLDGRSGNCNYTLDISSVRKNWLNLKDCIDKNKLPEESFYYKYTIDSDFLQRQSDKTLRDILAGKKVIGDWQISYSRYKKKHLELLGQSAGYTLDELRLVEIEYKKRHPKSKLEFK